MIAIGLILVGLTGSSAQKKPGLSDREKQQIEKAAKNNDLGSLIKNQTVSKTHATDVLKTNTLKNNVNNTGKKPTSSAKRVTLKDIEVCPYKYMTLVNQYNTIYNCIFNNVGDGRANASRQIKISNFNGEALYLLNSALVILSNVRGDAVNEKSSQYARELSNINSAAKKSYYLGNEFRNEVTKHAKNMYKKIISNTSPYGSAKVWTSEGWWNTHPHKESEAYKLLNSDGYKGAIAFGEFTNVVMPIVSNILTGYVVYKKFISNTPNKYNNYTGTNGTDKYTSPTGGGGVTSTIKSNGKTIDFGHGGRHLEGTGLNVNKVNQALASEVSKIHPGTGQFYKGQIIVDGVTIEYTSYGVKDGLINIGTYYPIK